MDYDVTAGLDLEQRAAVLEDGPFVAVMAGAGSGKTRCLTRRMVRHLIEGTPGPSILAITFTRAAAEEMKERISSEIDQVDARLSRYAMPEVTTLHGWAARQIRRHAEANGRTRNFVIYDQQDKADVLDLIAQDLDVVDKKTKRRPQAEALWRDPKVRGEYFRRLEQADALDFDMLVPLAITTVQRYPVDYRRVLVDESQDTSSKQWALIDQIKAPQTYMVGDFRQSIFSFQGSDPAVFLDRAEKASTVIQIHANYRSRPAIVKVGNGIIGGLDPAWATQRAARPQEDLSDPDAFDCPDEPLTITRLVLGAVSRHGADGVAVLGRTWRELDLARRQVTLADPELPVTFCGPQNDCWATADGRQLARVLLVAQNPMADQLVRLVTNWGEHRANSQKLLIQAMRERKPLVELLAGADETWRSFVDALDPGAQAEQVAQHAVFTFVRRVFTERGLTTRLETLTTCLRWLAANPLDLEGFRDYWLERGVQERMREQNPGVTFTTVHGCVAPDTLIETSRGLQRIDAVRDGWGIATPTGMHGFSDVIRNPTLPMLRITTRRGYSLDVTYDHRMFPWDGEDFTERRADQLVPGDWLRLRLGPTMEPPTPALPPLPSGDVRSIRHPVPYCMTEDLAELLGLIVADGTVYDRGFRLTKRHPEVVARFCALVAKCFAIRIDVKTVEGQVDVVGEVNSALLSSWLLLIGGVAPKAKAVPAAILGSGTAIQARFLRGLFEDGTVNVKQDGRVDHVAWFSAYPDLARTVQTMLLRQGIVSRRFPSMAGWRVDIGAPFLARFRDRIGFIADLKMERLSGFAEGEVAAMRDYHVLVPRSVLEAMPRPPDGPALWAYQNARLRGYLSRDTCRSLGLETPPWHHEQIRSIERIEGPSMCLTVPDGGRFLQNGFDAGNSKGLEWKAVILIGVREGNYPDFRSRSEIERNEDLRLLYVGATRAQEELWVTSPQTVFLPHRPDPVECRPSPYCPLPFNAPPFPT